MRVNPTAPIKNLAGEQVIEVGADGVRLGYTLGVVAARALLEPRQRVDLEEAMRRFALAKRLWEAKGPIRISEDDGEFIIACVAEMFTPLYVGRVIEILKEVR